MPHLVSREDVSRTTRHETALSGCETSNVSPVRRDLTRLDRDATRITAVSRRYLPSPIKMLSFYAIIHFRLRRWA